MLLYGAVSSRLEHSKRFTLYPPGRPMHSDSNSTSLGSIQPRCNYCMNSAIFQPIARNSFNQLSKLGHHWENENARASKQQQSGFESRVSRLIVRHSNAELQQSAVKLHVYRIDCHSWPNQLPTRKAPVDLVHFVQYIHDWRILVWTWKQLNWAWLTSRVPLRGNNQCVWFVWI